jgi:hypothetical protein
MGFFGPQLVVVSGLFGGNPLMDGIFWATTCCCLRPLFSLMELWLSGSHFHELFLFSHWNSGYHEAFFTNSFFFHDGILAITKPFSRTLSFFTMEFWLSRSLFHELFLFSRWNSGYHEAFFTNSFFFTMEFWLSRSLFHELFLFSRWTSGYHEGFFTNSFFFHDGILEMRDLGEDSFHIYLTKSIYTGSASLKTLPLDLEPPLQGKEYGPSYSNATRKGKTNFLSRNHL